MRSHFPNIEYDCSDPTIDIIGIGCAPNDLQDFYCGKAGSNYIPVSAFVRACAQSCLRSRSECDREICRHRRLMLNMHSFASRLQPECTWQCRFYHMLHSLWTHHDILVVSDPHLYIILWRMLVDICSVLSKSGERESVGTFTDLAEMLSWVGSQCLSTKPPSADGSSVTEEVLLSVFSVAADAGPSLALSVGRACTAILKSSPNSETPEVDIFLPTDVLSSSKRSPVDHPDLVKYLLSKATKRTAVALLFMFARLVAAIKTLDNSSFYTFSDLLCERTCDDSSSAVSVLWSCALCAGYREGRNNTETSLDKWSLIINTLRLCGYDVQSLLSGCFLWVHPSAVSFGEPPSGETADVLGFVASMIESAATVNAQLAAGAAALFRSVHRASAPCALYMYGLLLNKHAERWDCCHPSLRQWMAEAGAIAMGSLRGESPCLPIRSVHSDSPGVLMCTRMLISLSFFPASASCRTPISPYSDIRAHHA